MLAYEHSFRSNLSGADRELLHFRPEAVRGSGLSDDAMYAGYPELQGLDLRHAAAVDCRQRERPLSQGHPTSATCRTEWTCSQSRNTTRSAPPRHSLSTTTLNSSSMVTTTSVTSCVHQARLPDHHGSSNQCLLRGAQLLCSRVGRIQRSPTTSRTTSRRMICPASSRTGR